MAHAEQKAFFESLRKRFPDFFNRGKILEVGSLNVNGTVREFFDSLEEYIGIDVGPGPGVDIVAQGQDFDYPDEYFDVTLSAECFEHNLYWLDTFVNMHRMTKAGGLVAFTCASEGRAEHGTTRARPEDSPLTIGLSWDYYKNLSHSDFENSLPLGNLFKQYYFEYNLSVHDLYFWGIKP